MSLRTACLGLLMLLTACAGPAAGRGNGADKPNLIFIMADDLGYGDLGCFGQERIKTPNLDRIAAEGMKLTDFYAGSTVCAPSRCVLMTGLHTGRCYIRGNGKINLRPEDVTVAEVLKKAGYATGLAGKWGLGHEASTGMPTRQGFDFFFGYLDQHHAHNYYPTFLIKNEERFPLRNVVPNEGRYGQGVATKKVDYSHDFIAEEALKFIDRSKDGPFFLYLALTIPHANNEARAKGMEVPELGEYADKDWPEPQKGHAAMIARMDRDIGRLMDRLKKHGIDDKTLVIFTSDNGPHREGGNNPDFPDSNGPLRGIKRDLYEGGIRVPTLARWPGKIKPGSSSDHVGTFADLMATAAELAGVDAPTGRDSVSFLPALLGENDRQKKHDFVYWEFYERGSAQAVRMGKWKGVRKPMITGTIELYDLSKDLGEKTNIAEHHPGIVGKIRDAMKKAHEPTDRWKVRGRRSGAAATPRKPNVLLIMTDDQGWGDIGAHGNPDLYTPVLDRLSREGATFDRFYVSPVCAPTRASLLTGRDHLRTGVAGVTRGLESMRPEEVTIAEIFRNAGYATGCFGKWHNGAHYPFHPNGQGFDEFIGFCAGHWNNYFSTGLEYNGTPVPSKGYITDTLTDAAIQFMEKNRSKPFLCYVPYNAPHTPWQVPDAYFDKYKKRGLDDVTACAYAMVENIDFNVGRLLDSLYENGLHDDTIVLFLTDNGPNSNRYNGGMRGRKGSAHEGGVRVPLFVRWPRGIRPETKIPQIAQHIDILPTLAELCGVPVPGRLELDGKSLAPLLRRKANEWPDRMLYSHWGGTGNVTTGRGAVRTQKYRYVSERKREFLFDMEADPGQKKDLSKQSPEVFQKLRAAYRSWFKDVTKRAIERPSIPVGHKARPIVELPAPEAYLEGNVRWNLRSGWANDWVINWTSTEDSVAWELDVVEAARYQVTLLYTCPDGQTGSKVSVEAGGKRVEGTVRKAHDPAPIPSPDRVKRKEVYEKVWAQLTLGALDLAEGKTRLTVRAISKPGNIVMELKAVRLERAPHGFLLPKRGRDD